MISQPQPAPSTGADAPAPARVRVVTIAYHPGDELADFARTLADATTADVELVIVDNGTDPEVADRVAAEAGGRVVRTGANLGYGAGANAGAAGATAPWLVVANPDVVWRPGSLDALLAAGERHPSAGALGPALLNEDGTVYPSARELPSLTQGVGHALLGKVWPGNPWTRAYQRRQETAGTERVAGWLSGACLLLRREAFEAVGGFDEDYFMFFEDVDLGERLGRVGRPSVYVPSAQVVHVGGVSWKARPAAMISAHHRSAERYLHRRYARWYHWPVRAAVSLGLRAREAVELRAAR
ncbi:putative dTDP-rhamnosyltransferase [Cellulomonas hominis]|uniref:N-acetylglucosaminyl-diphospho-decaprenol L-rhamnosyltransferase n=1 Tax=Cellulomonas hominis TaxID=156981 RepID=A0A511FA87_9CELL|nr:glycosyltransferase family 2 protein [Cellulomonas hominis]MBB5474038.1 N-acetylglucosaminyl-diphospho-decaprenol L-rhamnosyltransferase [Cellulomonas hominis]GEL45167.1 putative dTDP-rhamnosyltransferase [Cellulomonas hominis]